MKFKRLCEYFSDIEKTSSRNEMTEILSHLYAECSEDESGIVSYLLVGRVAPLFVNAEFNLASKSILDILKSLAAIVDFSGDIVSKYNELGDLGLVAEYVLSNSKGQNIEQGFDIGEVYDVFWSVIKMSGTGSVDRKKSFIIENVKKLSPNESKYFVKILSQQLRLGCSSKTVLDALSFSTKGDKSDRSVIEKAFGMCSDLGLVAKLYLGGGVKALENIRVTPGVPVSSMLVEREKSVKDIFARINSPIVQPKFDGLRCQIHVGVKPNESYKNTVWGEYFNADKKNQSGFFEEESSSIKLFSRNLEDLTNMFPDVVESASKLNIKSGVFDSEVVGYDEDTNEFATFQSTMVRKRKYAVKETSQKQPIKAFVFDVLYLDGRELMDTPNSERLEILNKTIPREGRVILSESTVVSTEDQLDKIFKENVNAGLEGIIVKKQDSVYQPGTRGFDWIKLKRASQGHLADTVDVVILGYYFGRGKQVNFGIGALLGGLYDKGKDIFVTLTKIGTGVTDDQWRIIKTDLDKIEMKTAPDNVHCAKSLIPDTWVKPSIVATVEADEITRSPIHTAGKDKSGSGYALRFPRLKFWGRDKSPEDATSVEELKRMYKLSKKESE